ncbi:GntR family transcriptional regulator [Micromonospora sp. PPF5-17]|uniref:GntR family transcriptional regulator n=1 Tax=Micromonospora solifontis TaxID=2487138 RepID=A0ABX9WEW8_9ACTN|nr:MULTISPECIES: GntR family transcriptional regulator [Micromonospora]NES37398.1 GntR family transcriptional regulator [Micromonospora solifontis]NES58057.1 GntR family transcriptional regulator [Micromonospora sp. PPF5-6]RNL98406.1 GntR family transcriptional regulator [Micromonospora solifontis]
MATLPDGLRPIQRITLADDVYESVKALIMEHTIAPGHRINIDGLARSLAVSPTPVREALARLESDGLVHKRAMTGYTVSRLLSRREFEELFELRLLLEPAAAGRAAAHATADQRERISAQAAATVAVEPGADYLRRAAFTALDARFHDLVAEVSGNRLLRDCTTRLHAHLHLHRRYFPATDPAVTVTEHGRIAAAVAAGDPAAAAEAMRRHLLAAHSRHLPAFAADD